MFDLVLNALFEWFLLQFQIFIAELELVLEPS